MSLSPYWTDGTVSLHLGDCLEVLAEMETGSVDAIVTDPPYGLEFMGQDWDRPWAVTAKARVGFEGRENNLTLPSHRDGRNANCRSCGGRARGARRCECPDPDWDRPPLDDMREFQAWCEMWARECYRVLKPGGWILAFGGTRTWHRLTCGIEDAGFEIREGVADLTGREAPGLMWVYGSGFPKSLNVSKAIDKAAGAEREIVGEGQRFGRGAHSNRTRVEMGYRQHEVAPEGGVAAVTTPATPEAAQWEGWGTALKPAWEPIVAARKPLTGTVVQNVLRYGTGAINVDGCMVAHASAADLAESHAKNPGRGDMVSSGVYGADCPQQSVNDAGRWPPNIVFSHSPDCEPAGTVIVRGDRRKGGQGRRPGGFADTGADSGDGQPNGALHGDAEVEAWDCAPGCPVAELDQQSGVLSNCGGPKRTTHDSGMFGIGRPGRIYADSGGASRFFPVFRYQAKASTAERPRLEDGTAHETVKPLALMRWLVRLVTPPEGLVLDPFAGSGTTAEACIIEGFRCLAIDKRQSSCDLIRKRLSKDIQPVMFGEIA